jgi:hypothetical protein
VKTGPEGYFTLDAYLLPPGRYTVSAIEEGYRNASVQVDANGPESVHVVIVLEPERP